MVADQYASAVDLDRYGAYRITQTADDPRPLYRFKGRITEAGSSGFRAEPDRYHLYAGWFCPWSQRVTIQRALNRLDAVISISYVDNARDGRGWAFRERYGLDSVNGFRFLREAYEATEPGFDGHVSVPTLWDRATGRIVSNDYSTMDLDLATEFRVWSSGTETYPEALRGEIDALDTWLGPAVNHGQTAANGNGAAAEVAKRRLLESFVELDRRLASRRYLLGNSITAADIRLWVTLVRYQPNPPDDEDLTSLEAYPNLWGYARDLYQQPAFRATTRFEAFTTSGDPAVAWNSPHDRTGPSPSNLRSEQLGS
jgi:glutathionyl-hydroquinone reductase